MVFSMRTILSSILSLDNVYQVRQADRKARWVPKSTGSEKGSVILYSLKLLVEYILTVNQNLFCFMSIIDKKDIWHTYWL